MLSFCGGEDAVLRKLQDLCLPFCLYIDYSPSLTILSVKIPGQNFQNFALQDLKRLKDNHAWLSDPHVTLVLQFVSFCLLVQPLSD
jgi:hypothetical protein